MAITKLNGCYVATYDDEPLHLDMPIGEVQAKLYEIIGRDYNELGEIEHKLVVKAYREYQESRRFFYIDERIKDYVHNTNHQETFPHLWI